MTSERKAHYLDMLKVMSGHEGLSVELMDGITMLMDGISSEKDSDELEKELGAIKEKADLEMAEKNRILEAYRRRWDESMVGTRVNGDYVDKTVTEVSDYTYEKLLGVE